MGIICNEKNGIFNLQAKDMSYVIQVLKSGYIAHLYWGKRIKETELSYILRFRERALSPNPNPDDPTFSLDTLPQEYPAYGNSDFRHPAFEVQLENGSTVSDLRYTGYRIFKGKPILKGLPSTYVENENESETLELKLVDSLSGLKVVLLYTVYERFNVITRSVRFCNNGHEKLKLLRTLSMCVDFHDDNFDLLHLSGAWARERFVEKRPLAPGIQSIESRRGASSHQHNPFIALLSP